MHFTSTRTGAFQTLLFTVTFVKSRKQAEEKKLRGLHRQLPHSCGRMKQGHLSPTPLRRALPHPVLCSCPHPEPLTPSAPSSPSRRQHRSRGSLSSLCRLFECPRLSARCSGRSSAITGCGIPQCPGPYVGQGPAAPLRGRAGAEGSTGAGRDALDAHPRRQHGRCGA